MSYYGNSGSSTDSQNRRKGISPEVAKILTLALKEVWNLALPTGQFHSKIRRSCLNSRLQFRGAKITADSVSKGQGCPQERQLAGRAVKPSITLSASGPTSPPTTCSFAPTAGRRWQRAGPRGRTASTAARRRHRGLAPGHWLRPLRHTLRSVLPSRRQVTLQAGRNTTPRPQSPSALNPPFFSAAIYRLQTAPRLHPPSTRGPPAAASAWASAAAQASSRRHPGTAPRTPRRRGRAGCGSDTHCGEMSKRTSLSSHSTSSTALMAADRGPARRGGGGGAWRSRGGRDWRRRGGERPARPRPGAGLWGRGARRAPRRGPAVCERLVARSGVRPVAGTCGRLSISSRPRSRVRYKGAPVLPWPLGTPHCSTVSTPETPETLAYSVKYSFWVLWIWGLFCGLVFFFLVDEMCFYYAITWKSE